MSLQETVVDQKRQFLQLQKQILKKDIVPSRKLATIASEAGVPPRICSEVLNKVNRSLRNHSTNVHNRQMTEHVVEQIDLMYWESGAAELEADTDTATDGGKDDGILYQGDDLTQDKYITKLPTAWDRSDPASTFDNEKVTHDDYMDAFTRLHDLSSRRLTLQQKLTTYKTLLSLLEPYRKPKENIQPNLVGRDVPLAAELMKTRALAIRVAGRVGERYGDVRVPTSAEEVFDSEMAEDDGNAKLDKILSTW